MDATGENGKKKIWIIASAAVVLALAVGIWFGRPAYRSYKERRSVAQARAFFAKGDYANASVSARQALILNPNNLTACQIMASLAELARSPVVLDWRRRIAEIEPTVENKLILAASGLRYQSPPFAPSAQILEELPASATNLVAFHLVSAEMALKINRVRDAERHFIIAAALEPTNRLHQLNLAVVQLGATNQSLATAARAILETFRADTNLGPAALRSLVVDAIRRKDLDAAQTFSDDLLRQPRSSLEDQLQHLDVLKQSAAGALPAFIASLKQQHATNPPAIYGLAIWMVGNGLAHEAIAWIKALPEKIRAEQPVPLALNDCYVARKDWTALEEFLESQQWKDLEFLRFAYRSLAAEQRGETMAMEDHWRSAVREAAERPGALSTLVSLADRWHRERAKDDLLWRIVTRFPGEKWTYRELGRLYLAAGNTPGLNKLYGAMLGPNPNDLVLKNNLAATSLLLNTGLVQAHQFAREIFTAAPTNSVFVSTYAYSLHVQGKTAEGLTVLQKLDPAALAKQPVALYYGLLLWSAGKTNEAAPYLDTAAAADDLLPEEKILLAKCRRL